jgi:tetratricopeptide (TPR) repeat protein
MKRFLVTIASFAIALSAQAQSIVLKDGSKLGPTQFTVEGGKLMKVVKIGENTAKSALQASTIARLEFPTPDELTEGQASLAAGKIEEALEMLKKGRDYQEVLKDLPGNFFPELSFAYVDALNAGGKFDDVLKAMPGLRNLKLTDAQKMQLKILQLNVDRQTSSNYDSILGQADTILSETDDSNVGASISIIQGDVYVKQKDYEKALFSFLRVPVFYATQVSRVPEAELAAAGCLASMRRFEDATAYYKRLVETYPGSAIATKATEEEAKIRGLKNDDEAAKAKEAAAAKKEDKPTEEKK